MPKTPDKRAPVAPRRRAAQSGRIGSVRSSLAAASNFSHSAASTSAASPAGVAGPAATSSAFTGSGLAAAAVASSVSGSGVSSGTVIGAGSGSGAIGSVRSGPALTELGPQFSELRPLTSLFDPARPGKSVVRPSDLLALRLELFNMAVQASAPPMLKRGPASGGPSYIVLHFPPQALAEQVFFQAAVSGTLPPRVPPGAPPPGNPAANDAPLPPPIRARIAGESRLVFKVPDGFSVPYQLAEVLAACVRLDANVPANALPRNQGGWIVGAGGFSLASIAKLPHS